MKIPSFLQLPGIFRDHFENTGWGYDALRRVYDQKFWGISFDEWKSNCRYEEDSKAANQELIEIWDNIDDDSKKSMLSKWFSDLEKCYKECKEVLDI